MILRGRITRSNGAVASGTSRHDRTAELRVDVQPEPRGARVCPRGEIDLATVGSVRRAIDEVVAAGRERVVVDLRDVTFMDSTGLHLCLEADEAARADGWELQIIDGPRPVQRVFEIAGLRDRLPFVDAPPSQAPSRHAAGTRRGAAGGEA